MRTRTLFIAAVLTIAFATTWLAKSETALAGPCNPQQQQC